MSINLKNYEVVIISLTYEIDAMSFGFSVGDFIAVGALIERVITSLRHSSIDEYRELLLELHGLQRALSEVEHLKSLPIQEAEVNGLKVAALMCQYPLDEFAKKLQQFESMDINQDSTITKAERLKVWRKRLKWGFCMEEEVVKLRAYLVAHVGSLNMRLNTQCL